MRWLQKHMNADGSIGAEPSSWICYYRVAWTLCLTGQLEDAHRHLGWLAAHDIAPDTGELRVGSADPHHLSCGSYPMSCILMSASLLQRHDLVRRGLDRWLSWQDAESGGFVNSKDPAVAGAGDQVLFPAAQVPSDRPPGPRLAASRLTSRLTPHLASRLAAALITPPLLCTPPTSLPPPSPTPR